jgi:hypothetical protein
MQTAETAGDWCGRRVPRPTECRLANRLLIGRRGMRRRALPRFEAQRGVDQIEPFDLFVCQVPGDLGDQLVDDVGEESVAISSLVHRSEQRFDHRMLRLQRVHQRHLIGMTRHRGPQRRPQHLVFDCVVDDQELLELLPTERRPQTRPRTPVSSTSDPRNLLEITTQRAVNSKHHARVQPGTHRLSPLSRATAPVGRSAATCRRDSATTPKTSPMPSRPTCARQAHDVDHQPCRPPLRRGCRRSTSETDAGGGFRRRRRWRARGRSGAVGCGIPVDLSEEGAELTDVGVVAKDQAGNVSQTEARLCL